MSSSDELAREPAGRTSFDEFLGEAFATEAERVFSRLATLQCGQRERRVASAVFSAAVVSAHWLLATDEDVPGGLSFGVSAALLARFQAGERPDRDLIEWVIGVCAAVLVQLDLQAADRDGVLAVVSRTLEFDGLLDEIDGTATGPDGSVDRSAVLNRAVVALGDGTMPDCEFSPLALQLVAERFEEFLASV